MVDPDLIRGREKWTWTSGTKNGVFLWEFHGNMRFWTTIFSLVKQNLCWDAVLDLTCRLYTFYTNEVWIFWRQSSLQRFHFLVSSVGDAPAISWWSCRCGQMVLTTRSDPRILVGDTGEGLGTLLNVASMNQEALKKLFRRKPTTLIMTLISNWNPSINQKWMEEQT